MSDPLVQPLEHTLEKTGKALGEDAAHALSGVYHETAENAHTVAKNVEENEKKIVRTYFVDDDGSVKELRGGKLEELEADDKSGIRGILETNQNSVKSLTAEEKAEFTANNDEWKKLKRDDNEWVESKRIEKPTELSKSVEDVRRAHNNGLGDYGKSNYAALHYASEDGKEEFILVGRSSLKRSHSERSIGYPMVHHGKNFRVDELYTERRPCQSGSTCDRWLNMHVYHPENNPGLKVTHGVQYDSSLAPKEREKPFLRYIGELQKQHGNVGHGGTAGTQNFDVAPAGP